MSQFCKLEKISTVVYSDLKYLQGGSELEIPFVLLVQEPSEVFTLQFSVFRSNAQNTDEGRKYKLTLIFENFLHELSEDYTYEIFCKIFTDDKKYVPLFIHQLLRTEQSISITDEFLISDDILVKSVHIIFEIYRYNTKKVSREPISPSEQFYEMLNRMEGDSDITIVVQDKRFQVHRNILSLKSNVFKAMCTTNMSENLEGIVNIHDFSPEVVEEMLMYMYIGKCQNICKYSRPLFKIARQYELEELQAMCEEYFLFNLNIENVVSFVDLANLYDLKDLKIGATKFMAKREKDLVNLKVYQKYLCRNLNKETLIKNNNSFIIHIFELILNYNLEFVKTYVMKFIKEHKKDIVENKEILKFLKANPELMEEIFVYISR